MVEGLKGLEKKVISPNIPTLKGIEYSPFEELVPPWREGKGDVEII